MCASLCVDQHMRRCQEVLSMRCQRPCNAVQQRVRVCAHTQVMASSKRSAPWADTPAQMSTAQPAKKQWLQHAAAAADRQRTQPASPLHSELLAFAEEAMPTQASTPSCICFALRPVASVSFCSGRELWGPGAARMSPSDCVGRVRCLPSDGRVPNACLTHSAHALW